MPHGIIRIKLVHWPSIWVGCYIWYSEEGTGRGAASPSLLLAVPNVTAHPSTASVPITVLLYDGPLLCGFNVTIKGLTALRCRHTPVSGDNSTKCEDCTVIHSSVTTHFAAFLTLTATWPPGFQVALRLMPATGEPVQWRRHTMCVVCVRTSCEENT